MAYWIEWMVKIYILQKQECSIWMHAKQKEYRYIVWQQNGNSLKRTIYLRAEESLCIIIFYYVILYLSLAICVNSFLYIWSWFLILPYFGSFPLGILPILTFLQFQVPLRKKDFISSISQFYKMPSIVRNGKDFNLN